MALCQTLNEAQALEQYRLVQRLCLHHDHLKALKREYKYMREQQTRKRMLDQDFRCDPTQMEEMDESYFTSLIIKLDFSDEGEVSFKEGVGKAYGELSKIIVEYHRGSNPEIYFDSAHITIKSILDFVKQDEGTLKAYLPVITPIVEKWTGVYKKETKLYGIGLFTNLAEKKGLSVGVRFYPTTPMIQVIRGEVGVALYENAELIPLRPEKDFHTMLTHSTGFRVRGLTFPLKPEFVKKFMNTVERYDRTVFGVISNIGIEDIFIRNGKGDKLVPFAEISLM